MNNTIIAICLFGFLTAYGQESAVLDTNDVSARIYADGRLFNGQFEVPKGSGKNTIDQVGFWIGGYYEANNFLIAAQINGKSGTDYFYGPIASNYNDSSYISRYNNVWKVNKSTIDYHINNFKTSGYNVPKSISNWPGNGNTANGEYKMLAPFVDKNFDGIYDPVNGDYPKIKGDQAVFFIVNDSKEIHSQSHGGAFQIEIQGMAYSYSCAMDSALNQTVFLNLKFYNRASKALRGVIVGLLTDMNIGNRHDDFVGSDYGTYTYNAYAIDSIYGDHPPVQGCVLLSYATPYAIVDWSGLINFNNNENNEPLATGAPQNPIEYYRYLSGSWRDGTPLTKGGLGYNPGSTDVKSFAFDGDPTDPLKKEWTEIEAGNIPGDRKILRTIGVAYLNPNNPIILDVAFPFARDYSGDNLTSINILHQRIQYLQSNFIRGYNCTTTSVENEYDKEDILISIYPNPNNGVFHLAQIQNLSNKNFKLEIYNTIGTKIYEYSNATIKEFKNFEIDISSQPAGIYFVKIADEKKLYSAKIVIQ